MSRVNKYRGKRIDKEEWIAGFYVQLPKVSLGATIVAGGDLCAEDVGDYIIVNKSKKRSNFSNSYPLEIVECEQYEIDPDTVGQYIGVKDKYKKEIYEGDIVKSDDGKIGQVQWFEEHLAFMIWCITDNKVYFAYDNDFSKIEVIGNVYDNADLLREEGNE